MEKEAKKAGPRSAGSALKFEPVEDAKVVPGARARALKAGPHGKQHNADGSLHSTPNPGHKPGRKSTTDGGTGGLKGL
jgi:hypothetical protein